MIKPILLLSLAFLAASPWRAQAAQCVENRDYYQSLPTVIGREDNVVPFGFVLKCDTVFVRKGVTTVIHPGTMLYFAAPTLNSVIKVEGTLIIKGAKTSYVYLSGSLDTSKSGTRQTGNRQWGGIEVSESGRLEMEYAGVVRAPTPITTFSDKIRIVNSFFKGSSGIILPDGSLMPLEINWHAVNHLNLEKGPKDSKPTAAKGGADKGGLSEEEKTALLAQKKGFWTWRKAAGGAAALAVVAVGAAYMGGENGTKPTPPDDGPTDHIKPDTRDERPRPPN